jgi:hypothetical protein
MSKTLKISFSMNFARNMLQIQATGSYAGFPHHGVAPTGNAADFRLFRQYPLSELEARALHFKGSNPVKWIEEHEIDLILLTGFQTGYDLRDVEVATGYAASFAQDELGAPSDGKPTPIETHLYQWSHDIDQDVLLLTDNGIEIGRFPCRGPQNYLQLAEFQADVESRKVVILAESAGA